MKIPEQYIFTKVKLTAEAADFLISAYITAS